LNNKLYVVNKGKVGERTISVIDTETDKVQGAPIMIEGYPHDILAVGNKIYVATSDNISVIDPATEQVQAIINLKRAEKLAVVGNKLYAMQELNDRISVIDISTDQLEHNQTVFMPANPTAMVAAGDKLLIATPTPKKNSESTLSIVDTITNKIKRTFTLECGAVNRMIVAGSKLYMAISGMSTEFKVLGLSSLYYLE
jgi:YVTN family beta-propeller protein